MKKIASCTLLLLAFVFRVISATENVTKIAFSLGARNPNGLFEYFLITIDSDGRNEKDTLLPNDPASISWSPDHTKLMVSYYTGHNFLEFYDDQGALISTYKPTTIKYPFFGENAIWFGNNEEILLGFRGENFRGSGFFVYNIVNKSETIIVLGSSTNTYNFNPRISPDSKTLIFQHQEWETQNWLLVISLDRSKFPYPGIDFYNNIIPKDYEILDGPVDQYYFLEWRQDSNRVVTTRDTNSFIYNLLDKSKKRLYFPQAGKYTCGYTVTFSHISDMAYCIGIDWDTKEEAILIANLVDEKTITIKTGRYLNYYVNQYPGYWSHVDSAFIYYCPQFGKDWASLCIMAANGSEKWNLYIAKVPETITSDFAW